MLENKIIMQVLPSLEMGGVERGTVEMAAYLQKNGVHNIVVSTGGRMVEELQQLGVEHITLPISTKNPFKIWLNAARFAHLMRERKISLIHVRSRAPAWSVKLASQKTGIPFVTTFHGFYGLKPRWLKKRYNRVMTQGTKVIAVSDFVKDHLVSEYGVAPEKIARIHRGADLTVFDPAHVTPEQIKEMREALQISADMPVIAMAGRFSRWKGHAVLARALGLIKHEGMTGLFFGKKGSAEVMDRVQKELDQLPPSRRVITIEKAMDMPVMCMLSDVMVSASTEPEPFGRVAVEAQAMGRIIVATDIGGSCETVIDGKTGFLVPPNNAQALADKLDFALNMKPEARAAMEKAAREHVVENFSIEKMCAETVKLYEEVLKTSS